MNSQKVTTITMGARLLLGLLFLVFGLNGFFNFLPMPPPPEAAMKFLGGLFGAGYFFPFLKSVEVICSLLLLSGFFAPLALVILAPIVVNIFLFHTILAPAGAPLAILILVLEVIAAWGYRDKFAPLLKAK